MENLVSEKFVYEPRQIIAGSEVGVVVKEIKIKKDQGILLSGTVLGIITENGISVQVDSTASDGSQIPDSVLTDTIDTA